MSAIESLFASLELPDYSDTSDVAVFLHNWDLSLEEPNYVRDFIEDSGSLLLFRPHQSQSVLRLLRSLLDVDNEGLVSFVACFTAKVLTTSPINKLRVFSAELVQFLLECVVGPACTLCIRHAFADILVCLAELGLSYEQLALLYTAALSNQHVFDLFHSIFESYPVSFQSLILTNSAQLDFADVHFADYRKGFTLSFWFQLHSGLHRVDEPILDAFMLITLCQKDANSPILRYTLDDTRLVVHCIDPASLQPHAHVFESFSFELGRLYNVSLVHHTDRTTKSSVVDLFVDGEFIESRATEPIFAHLLAAESQTRRLFASKVARPLDVTVSIHGSATSDNVIPEMLNLLLVSGIQARSWILLAHALGPNYAGTYQDSNLIATLNPKARVAIRLKIRELESDDRESQQDFHLDASRILLNFHCLNSQTEPENRVRINVQGGSAPQPVYVSTRQGEDILFWDPDFLVNRLFSIGGSGVLLRMIAESATTQNLVKSLSLLFHVLETDWRSLAEFGAESGYDILATLLKTKRPLINMDVLTSILQFIGYNEESPADSLIANILAYRSLIVDFEIWQPYRRPEDGTIDQQSKDTFKFVLFQLSMFCSGSKYHAYNLQKLGDMKIVRRVIQELKYRLVDEDMLPILHDSLLILVRQNPSAKVVKALCLYVVYSLDRFHKSGAQLDLQCARSVLSVIVSLVCDSTQYLTTDRFRHLIQCVNAKWLMVLLDDSDAEIVGMALQLLLKVLVLLGPKSQKAFNDSGGVAMLRKCLAKDWANNDVLLLLISGLFGSSRASSSAKKADPAEFIAKLAARGSKLHLTMPFLFPVLNALVLTASQNTDESLAFDAQSLANWYCQFLVACHDSIPATHHFFTSNLNWANETMLLATSTPAYSDLLSRVFIECLMSKDAGFVQKCCTHDPGLFALTVSPRIISHIADFGDDAVASFSHSTAILVVLTQYFASAKLYEFSADDYRQGLDAASAVLHSQKPSPACTAAKAAYAEAFVAFAVQSSGNSAQLRYCCSLLMGDEKLLVGSMRSADLAPLLAVLFRTVVTEEDAGVASLASNCLRMVFLSAGTRKKAAEVYGDESVRKMVDGLALDDTELREYLVLNSRLLAQLEGQCRTRVSSQTSKEDYTHSLLSKYLSSVNISNPKRWNLKSLANDIVKTEYTKFNRHIQDDKDDLQYYISMYERICARIPVDELEVSSRLDSTEGRFRMRKKTVAEPVVDEGSELDSVAPVTEAMARCELGVADSLTDASIDASTFSSDIDASGYEFVSGQVDLDVSQEDKNRKIIRSLYVHDKIVRIFNVTQIQGLQMTESILIIGLSRLYLIENYLHTSDGEIIDIDDAAESLVDPYVQLIMKSDPSRNGSSSSQKKSHHTRDWRISDLVSVSKRQFLLRDVAVELFFVDGSSILVTCGDRGQRDSLLKQLAWKITAKYTDKDLEEAMQLASRQKASYFCRQDSDRLSSMLLNTFINTGPPPSANFAFSKITKKWKRGEISNFYYLMLVNTVAGRTFNDLTQYPVFPFVIADYESDVLDLSDPKTFRDLSKPMGAQSDKRARQFQERYEASAEMAPDVPPAHYGTHYSSAMVVASYMIRVDPFVRSYLILQGGKFDHADRLFHSMAKTWKSASCDNTSDVRELIPEFYYLPEFLVNANGYDFGELQDGTPVNDVRLPPWAHNDPKMFVTKMRQALESPYVSEHLPEWIDLVFGYKQRGAEAVKALNVFHHLSYAGAINLDSVKDEHEKTVLISTIHNFGQTPLQIFGKPHPKRWTERPVFHIDVSSLLAATVPVSIGSSPTHTAIDRIVFDPQTRDWNSLPETVRVNGKLSVRRYSSCNLIVNESLAFEQLAHSSITRFELLGEGHRILVAFEDGTLVAYRLTADPSSSITNSQRSSILHSKVHPSAANPGCLELQSIDVLRGHSSAVCDIRLSHYNGVVLTLGAAGDAILWNLANYERIRTVSESAELAAIAEESGHIAVVDSDDWLSLMTINGWFVQKTKLRRQSTCLEFAEFNSPFEKNLSNCPWTHLALCCVGFEDGGVEVYELQLDEAGWLLAKSGEVRVNGSVSSLKLKLTVNLDGEGGKVGRGQLLVGTSDGELLSFIMA